MPRSKASEQPNKSRKKYGIRAKRNIDLLHGEKRDWSRIMEYANEYLMAVDIPIITEFANAIGAASSTLYTAADNNPEVREAIRMLSDEKQAILEEGALTGKLNATMAIFSLKQMGWKDRVDMDARLEARVNPLIEAIQSAAATPSEGKGGYSGGIES